MSEIPERIEREMFEIRNRMAPDVRDLRKHTEPQVIGKQVGKKIKDRIKGTVTSLGKGVAASAKRQFRMVGEASRKGEPSRFTDAVKSDPRPLILLAILLAASLLLVRRMNGDDEE